MKSRKCRQCGIELGEDRIHFCSDKCRNDYRNEIRRIQYRRKTAQECRSQTLCWKCERADHNYCSWVADHKPIDGWETKETLMKTSTSTPPYKTYKVIKCPQFVEEVKKGN